jgi:hypothetical protein
MVLLESISGTQGVPVLQFGNVCSRYKSIVAKIIALLAY